MKFLKLTGTFLFVLILNSCASGYQPVRPAGLNYNSISTSENVSLQYKYDLLDDKYEKKEKKKDVRLVAVKITNTGEKDMVFGEDIRLTYENGSQLLLLEQDKVFKELKQHPATHLFYLPLTLLNLTISSSSQQGNVQTQNSNTIPVGLILGPGLAGGNLYHAARANKKFKNDLNNYDLQGRRIAAGETVYGLVGVRADNYDALKVHISKPEVKAGVKQIAR